MNAQWRHQTIFPDEPWDLICLGSSLLDQLRPDPMHRLYILLLRGLERDKTHRRQTHHLTHGRGVIAVALVALHIRFNELARHQFYLIASSH